ncbi:Pre-mRNA polyadenylation factor Fip1 [Macleaya cordata]|uniref:Pre-mRNA polyadenylation factor Fip1 n=1 Tax=Macleaya cordata TaxID=56857 RepID=A0A200QIP3_MACCD|nr:Pre-mRNA polyadenylation factor Fip1 [Macleaya cordata]
MEDDDDDFGDLYTDVLRPFSTPTALSCSSAPPPSQPLSLSTFSSNPPPPPSSDPNNLQSDDDDDILFGAPDPKFSLPSQTLISDPKQSTPPGRSIDDEAAPNRNNDKDRFEEQEVSRVSPKVEVEEVTRVLESSGVQVKSEPCVSSEIGDVKVGETTDNKDRVFVEKGDTFTGQVKLEDNELDAEPIIPGLSSSSPPPPFNPPRVFENEEEDSNKTSKREDDDWEDSDSDSEDDLQIVLNEPVGVDRNENEDEEDGEDLVIVAGGDQIHHNQLGEEQQLGEDLAKPTMDGERKEIGEGPKAPNGGMMVNAVGPRPIYNNQGFHPHHSQFKYVRPGAAAVPGGAMVGPAGVQSQVRPPVNMGPLAGAGRGDWRPMGMKTAPMMQKNFQPGFGFPGWGNNSLGIGFGRGPEFTLPSHKTVFDIDIDSFEEKPWRHPGVDTSDFFNFGLNEETWKDYCKQLGQLRLEATMQSKIRVYESGRSVQDYDPDLPPELAAAAGVQDFAAENPNLGRTDGGQGDLTVQGRGAAHSRPLIPTGRAIQVEAGYGAERVPSTESRQPRMRDSDAIIEIVLQDSVDDDSFTENGTHEQLDNELQGEDLKGDRDNDEDVEQPDNESFDPFPYNGTKKEIVGRRDPFVGSVRNNIHEGDGILPFPSEAAIHYHPGSKGRSPVYSGGIFGTPHEGRRPQGTVRDRYSHLNAEDGNDVIPNQGASVNRSYGQNNEKSGRSSGGNRTPESSSQVQVDAARVPIEQQKDDMHNELATTDSSVRGDGDEMGRDTILTSDTTEDGGLLHSVKKQLTSQVEQPAVQEIDEGYDLRTTRSSDNSRARSESSRDYQKKRDGGEEEVVQEDHARRMGDMRRRRDEDEHSFRKRGNSDRDGRQEIERNLMPVKVREDSYHSHRDPYPNSAYHSRTKTTDFEMRRESNSTGARQRRDEDTHVRRVKDEDTRKRERAEEIGSRHGSKARESESNERDEHHHSRKRLDNSEWRSRHEKVVGHSQKDRDDYSMNRHENLNDPPTKRRKDEEHPRREQAEKEEYLHGFRPREGTSRRKRESDDFMEQMREDRPRLRDKPDDQHFIRHRDEDWRQRERDDWQRLKQPHEDTLSNRQREEGRGAVRNSRGTEDKPLVGNARAKDESRGLGFEKDYPFKDKKRQSEQPKRREREEDGTLPQHRGREDVYASEKYTNNGDRNPRHERSSKNNDHYVDNRQWLHKERPKETSRSKESEGGDQTTVARSKRKHEEPSAHRNVKVSTKGASEQESGNLLTSGPTESRVPGQSRTLSSSSLSKKNHQEHEVPQQHNSSRSHREDASSDDERQNTRRRQSKQDSFMSDKERNRSTNSKTKETNKKNNKNDPSSLASEQPDEPPVKKVETVDNQHQHTLGEGKAAGDTEITRSTPGSRDLDSDRIGEDRSHLDTVAKLRKRSERFKLPMPSEKDASGNRKMDNEVVTAQSETAADAAEIKPERPARKRKWGLGMPGEKNYVPVQADTINGFLPVQASSVGYG